MPARGEQQQHVQLGSGAGRHVVRRVTDHQYTLGDTRILNDAQPTAGRHHGEALHHLWSVSGVLGPPLPGLPARDQPVDRFIKQRRDHRQIIRAADAYRAGAGVIAHLLILPRAAGTSRECLAAAPDPATNWTCPARGRSLSSLLTARS